MVESYFIFAIISTLVSCSASLADLNTFHPQIPSSVDSQLFASSPSPLMPTDGGEIRPNYDGADWNRRDSMFNTTINPKSSGSSDDWFPSILSNSSNGSGLNNNTFNNSNTYNTLSASHDEFMHKISVINANNFYTSSAPYHRDQKLLSLAYNLLSATSRRRLNVLHWGGGTGFVPLGLAILGRADCKIVSLDDRSGSSSQANENILKDGKGYFLRNLSFSTVDNIQNVLGNRLVTGKSFDLVVLTKSVPRNFSFPNSILGVINPRGFLIYPEDGKVLKMDQFEGNGGRLTNIKTLQI